MKIEHKKKLFTKNTATVLAVVILYIIVSYLTYSGGASRQLSNMLIPISTYIVLAVSLNLVVGLLGELSLGHAGFMSVGLFSGCLVSIALADALPIGVRLPLAMIVGGLVGGLRLAHRPAGAAPQGRLSGHRDPGLR